MAAPYRTPSFRDLQRQCAFLQGRVQELGARNELQNREAMEAKVVSGQQKAALEALKADHRQAVNEHCSVTERSRQLASELLKCQQQLELVQQHARLLQEQVGAAAAREAQMMSELGAARTETRESFQQLGATSEELRDTAATLRDTANERDQIQVPDFGRPKPAPGVYPPTALFLVRSDGLAAGPRVAGAAGGAARAVRRHAGRGAHAGT
eukprot:6964907-Prymnesium_polylepis.1